MQNDSETNLSAAEIRALRCIAGMMIPPSTEFGVPGADDAIIFSDIVKSLGRDLGQVREALGELAVLAGGDLTELDAARRDQAVAAFRARRGTNGATLSRVILQCYYRDDRVLHSLGLEPRAPFPQGHVLEQGDWSLLDPVRSRPKMWRDAP
jgi:hypothetical protein